MVDTCAISDFDIITHFLLQIFENISKVAPPFEMNFSQVVVVWYLQLYKALFKIFFIDTKCGICKPRDIWSSTLE